MQLQSHVLGIEVPLAFDGLALELLSHGYRACGFFEIHCEDCGTFRIAVPVIGGEFAQRLCPVCSTPKPRAAYLAFGFSKRAPFYETVYLSAGRTGEFARIAYAAEFRRKRQAHRASLGPEHAATVGRR